MRSVNSFSFLDRFAVYTSYSCGNPPSVETRGSKLPSWTISPSSSTTVLLASLTLCSRCAITTTVLPRKKLTILSTMKLSVTLSGFNRLSKSRIAVDLPLPLAPTNAVILPPSKVRDKPCTTGRSAKEKEISLNSMIVEPCSKRVFQDVFSPARGLWGLISG